MHESRGVIPGVGQDSDRFQFFPQGGPALFEIVVILQD
jgi:hypothetical protein